MHPSQLRQEIRESARSYAQSHDLDVDCSWKSAIIFRDLADALHRPSFDAICDNEIWRCRTKKSHQQIDGVKEMQSSNSSDALLMSIFCHPELSSWKGVADVLGFSPTEPEFGYKPRVAKKGTNGDETEIDMAIDGYFVEAKLTETDFTEKAVAEVEKYEGLASCFHTECLCICDGRFQNYQVIRNLLASTQHRKHHMLLCDERRPDLVRRYMKTVCCLRDEQMRKGCRVVFWQEIWRACGRDLGDFLQARYGLR